MRKWLSNGQSVFEYAILLAIVSGAFLSMSIYVKRAVQGQLYKLEEKTIAQVEGGTSAPPTGTACPPLCI